jgi:hypothetical protein
VKTRLLVSTANDSVVALRRSATTLQTNASNGSGIAGCRYGTSFSHSLGRLPTPASCMRLKGISSDKGARFIGLGTFKRWPWLSFGS